MCGQGSLFHPPLSSTTKNYFSFRHIIRLIQSNPMFLPEWSGHHQAGHPRGEHPDHGGGSRLQDQDGDEAPGHHPVDQCDHLRVVRSDGKVINKYKGQKNAIVSHFFDCRLFIVMTSLTLPFLTCFFTQNPRSFNSNRTRLRNQLPDFLFLFRHESS